MRAKVLPLSPPNALRLFKKKREESIVRNLILILLTVVAIGCDDMQKTAMNVIREPAATEIADVLIYTRITWWITPTEATAEAEITKQLLVSKGIKAEITESELFVRDWMQETNANGSVNVLILYGVMPNTIYPSGNNLSDASIAEKWIETPDGDTILNHADYFAYSFSEVNATQQGTNGIRALQNLMDFPVTISVSDYNRPMIATPDGNALTPSLTGFESDRPFPLRQLQGDWFAEKVFASDTGNTQANYADPVILRDGDLGRLAIVHQTRDEDNPKGEVAAEIIINTLFADKPVSIIAEPAEPVEEPTPENSTGITDIFTDIDLPTEPTIPEGADVLDTDRVFHYTTETFLERTQTRGGIVIEAGENPLENEGVLAFFQETKAWAEEFCGKPSYISAPDLHIYSNSRAEREAFKDSLPGGWTKNPSGDDPWWYIHVENTIIVDSRDVYYTVLFKATSPCAFRN